MKSFATPLLLASVAAGLVACSGTPSMRSGGREATVSVGGEGGGTLRVRNEVESSSAIIGLPIDKVWAALPAAFDSLGVTVTSRDPVKRIMGTEGIKVRQRIGGVPLSRYFDCGTTQIGANADSYEVMLMLMAQLKAAPGNTTSIVVSVDARARPVAFSQGYSECSSMTNSLDARLIELVRRQASR